jgi:aryl-alcohol dehydrogenase-like predicted oxidoreductase
LLTADPLQDKNVPIETTLKTLEEEYVKTGKLGGIALSEVSAATVERAAKATKIVAVEVEVSLWSTDIFQNGVADACAKLGIPVVAYVFWNPFFQSLTLEQLLTNWPWDAIRRNQEARRYSRG